ncbi:TPA: hypothetical protein PP869_002169 [Staphylococcus aureus]|nr:hypothetical protein [Staphylococcus aureus]
MIKKISLTTVYIAVLSFVLSNSTFGATNPAPKLEQGFQQVQTILTGLLVAVGICAGVWIVLKKMPGIDDPMVKNEMFRGVGMVLAGVAVGAALVWLVPWVYNLFQ